MTIARRVLGSSALLIGIKVVHRSLGLISTLVLARLLTPADFGLVALVSITVYFFDVLSSAGSDQYIIRKAEVSVDDLDTAWTIDLLMKLALWLTLQAGATLIAVFFDQPNLEQALRVGACVLPINALASARLNILKQDLDYRGIFWLSVIQRTVTFSLVIALSFALRSYWAMIIGDIFSSAIFTLGSYKVARHRPRLTLVHARQQWTFSSWMLLKSIVGYTRSQIDTLFVSKLFPAATLGQYHLARDIAMLPAHNLIVPGTEPLLALFRGSRDSPKDLAQHLRWSLITISSIVLPVSAFLTFFADIVVTVLLGDQWVGAAAILSCMAPLLLYFCYTVVYERLLVTFGRIRILFALDCLSLGVVMLALTVVAESDPATIALMRGAAGCLNLLIVLVLCHLSLPIAGSLPFRPFVAVVAASALATMAALNPDIFHSNPALLLLLQGTVFAVCYIVILLMGLFLASRDEARAMWRAVTQR